MNAGMAIESPNPVDVLLGLMLPRFRNFQCGALHRGEGMASATSCVLEKNHEGVHQGVEVFIGRRGIAWDGEDENLADASRVGNEQTDTAGIEQP